MATKSSRICKKIFDKPKFVKYTMKTLVPKDMRFTSFSISAVGLGMLISKSVFSQILELSIQRLRPDIFSTVLKKKINMDYKNALEIQIIR